MTDIESRSPITVLEATTPPDGTTRYIDQIVAFSHPTVTFEYFSWKRALFSRYDVLHVHWPENLVRHRSRARRVFLPFLLLALIGLLKVRRVAILRTLHNLDPHESGSAVERVALRYLDRATDVFVTINPVTRAPRGIEVSIPHGHYRTRFAVHEKNDIVPGTITYAGLIRPYKGVERLVDAFKSARSGTVAHLRIVGNPTPELRAYIDAACARDPRITANLQFVPDADLVAELTRAELVCLPYDEMHNSGMALVGLSLNRPILVPETATTRALADEVGDGWVHFFKAPFDASQLVAAADAARASAPTRGDGPRLEDRDWRLVGERYERAFRLAVRSKAKL